MQGKRIVRAFLFTYSIDPKEELMKSRMHPFGDPNLPPPLRFRPTWMTWVWMAFIVAVIVLTAVAFLGNPLR